MKNKRSELVEKFHLEGFPDERIISVAQKEFAADQRLREAKEAENQRLQPGSSEGQSGTPTDQLAEPHPDDADGLAPERSPHEPNQLDEEKLDEIAQRVQFGDGRGL